MTGIQAPPNAIVARLRLMATTDLHSHLIAHDYYADKPDMPLGLTRVATLIKQARAEAQEQGAATLLFDNGDAFQGAPIGESVLHGQNQPHPLMTAFRILGYDAMGLGNHDFNYGLSTLERLLRDAPCPALCSNMSALEDSLALPFKSSAIVERKLPNAPDTPPVRIGILSVLPPQTVIWDAYYLEGRVMVQDMVNAAREVARDLRDQGCDLVVALAHTGMGEQDAVLYMENALGPISAISEIDAIVAGHTHLVLPDPKRPDATMHLQRPVVKPGAFGSHLGLIDLSIWWDGAHWRVFDAKASTRAVTLPDGTLVPEDSQLRAALMDDHIEACARLNHPIGQLATPLHSFFTFISHDRSLDLTACAQAAAVRVFVQGTRAGELPILSAVSPAKFGARSGPSFYTDVPAGTVTMRHLTDLQVFPNRLHAVEITGAGLLDWLEMSAGVFNQITPGQPDQPLLDQQRVGHNYDIMFGVEYDIDLTQASRYNATGTVVNPAANRIANLRWNGMPVDPDQRFLVALSSYRASGGGHFNMVRHAPQLSLPPVRLRDVVRDYIAGHLKRDPLADAPSPWRFSPIGGDTSVIALTGPAAASHLDELPANRLSLLPANADGFIGLRLKL